jgi:hypothetical protein
MQMKAANLFPLTLLLVAFAAGCGPIISKYDTEERLLEIAEESGPPNVSQVAGMVPQREIVVAVPESVVFMQVAGAQRFTSEAVAPMAMWSAPGGDSDFKDFVKAQRKECEAKGGRKVLLMTEFPDFGATVRKALERRAAALNAKITVRTDSAAAQSADVVITLDSQGIVPRPEPDKRHSDALVSITVRNRSGQAQAVERKAGPVAGIGPHLAWAIPCLVITFPISLAWVPSAMGGVQKSYQADQYAAAIDGAINDALPLIFQAASAGAGPGPA